MSGNENMVCIRIYRKDGNTEVKQENTIGHLLYIYIYIIDILKTIF